MIRKSAQALTVLLFGVALALPSLDSFLHLDETLSLDENRELHPRPEWEWNRETILDFPRSFELFYDDHFGFRNLLVRTYSLIRLNYFGISPNEEKAVIGSDGWMFIARSLNQPLMTGYATPYEKALPADRQFDENHLKELALYFESNQRRLARMGILYVIVACPDKKDIYGEFVPRKYLPRNRSGWHSQIATAYLKEHSTVPVIDVRSYLKEQKDVGPLYYKTDSHWNDLGAFLSSGYIADQIREILPNIPPSTRVDSYEFEVYKGPGKDLTSMIGLSDVIEEPYWVRVILPTELRAKRIEDDSAVPPKYPRAPRKQSENLVSVFEQDEANFPKVVVFADSFSLALKPFLSEYFQRSVYYWQNAIQEDILEKEKPDIVIHEIVGRSLYIFNQFPRTHSWRTAEANSLEQD